MISYRKKELFPEVSSESNLITDFGYIKQLLITPCTRKRRGEWYDQVQESWRVSGPQVPRAHLSLSEGRSRRMKLVLAHPKAPSSPPAAASSHPRAQTVRLPTVIWACPELGKRPRSAMRLRGLGGWGEKDRPKVQTKNLFA